VDNKRARKFQPISTNGIIHSTRLENAEKLEQLRALENAIQIAVVKVDYDSSGVDAPEDVARVEEILKKI
jgi:CMP-2-keto-3-deoxyoctulosonic acid synthetase